MKDLLETVIQSQTTIFQNKVREKLGELVDKGIDINDIIVYYHEPIWDGNIMKFNVTFDLKRKNCI